MADKFQTGDRVFAKIKGWPPWPARVVTRAEGKAVAYLCQFYGTYDTSTVKPDCMYVYNDENKAKYGKPKNSHRWKEAMEEIEENVVLGDGGPVEGEESGPMDVDPDTDNDGELMIDEGPSQPPILLKEGGKSSNQNGKPEPPKGRRGSKASLSKRDSISSTSSTAEPTTPAAATTPSTEMVSRSGRKIKPKRFADDEISSTPTPTKTKAAVQDESNEGPPTKRAKRGGKTPPAKKASPPPPERKEAPPTRARMVVGKGKGAPPKASPNPGRVSPDISSPIPRAPALKPAAVAAATSGTQRKSEALPPVGKKPLPALIPAASTASTLPQSQPPPQSAPVGRRAPALRQQSRQEQITDEEESGNDAPPVLAMGDDEVEADDKENLKESTATSSTGSEAEGESESEMEKNSEIDETSSRYSEVLDETLTKIPFIDKEGESFELRLETKQEFESEEERIGYDNTVATVVKIKDDLEQGDQETHDTLQDLLEQNKDEFDPDEAQHRERRAAQIRTLRIEGEVIEIIGEIVSCLAEKHAECYRALELLDRLGSHDLTALILKKHPEVVQTVGKLRNYVGNVDQWDMNEDQLLDFKESATAIRVKAAEIYENFYNVFVPPEERIPSVTFEDIFLEELKVFKEMTVELTLDEVLGLTAEAEGGFEFFDAGELDEEVDA